MLSREEVAEILFDIRAVSVSTAHPFKYSSGMLSPIYTNCRRLGSYPAERKAIADTLAELSTAVAADADIIVAVSATSLLLATCLAQRLSLPMAYVRSAAKDHGRGRQIEGKFSEGQKALLISDIISTEKNIQTSVQVIQEHGGSVVACLAVFDNCLGIIEGFLEKCNIPLFSLTDLKSFLQMASVKKAISPAEKAAIEGWIVSPEAWNTERLSLTALPQEVSREVAEILLNIGAVKIRADDPFKYVSGMLSPVYTDIRLLMSHPREWAYFIDLMAEVIIHKIGCQNVDFLAGTPTSGIPHTTYLAERLCLPMIYVEGKSKDRLPGRKIEGDVGTGKRALMIEDLVSTGLSSISAARRLREAGVIVDSCLAIFTYELESSIEGFKNAELGLFALCDLDSLLNTALCMKMIDHPTRHIVEDWAKDPHNWRPKSEG